MAVRLDDLDWDEIRKEIEKQHLTTCPADPEKEPDIYLDLGKDQSGLKDSEFEIYAECQNCIQGGWTIIKDKPEYHKHASNLRSTGSSGYAESKTTD